MKVGLFFSRHTNALTVLMYGTYSECGILFFDDTVIEAFYSIPDHVYSRRVISRDENWNKFWNNNGLEVDFLLLSVDAEEIRRLRATCEACVKVKKPFNMRDVLLIHVPFREPEEFSVTAAPSLNNTQAVILILRECLNQENSIQKCLEGLNSRQTYMDTLYNRLAPYTLSVFWCNLINFLKK